MAKAPTKNAPKAEAPATPTEKLTHVPRFGWNTTAEGLAAKSVLVLLAEEGKTLPKGACDEVRRLVPQLADRYKRGTVKTEGNGNLFPEGRDLTNAMITGRHQYMWFTAARGGNDAVKGEMSREHPLHEGCNARFAAAYQIVKARGIDKPFTANELEALLSTASNDKEAA